MDKRKKKQLKKYIAWASAALMVLVLAVLPLVAGNTAPADGPQASILNTTVQYRTIETQLIGGGQLSSNATEEITIPAEIKLTKYLVGNGDIVKEGDPIAVVDKVSVLTALAEVQETLDYYAGKLASAAQKSDADKVTAHAGGLLKTIYAQEGDSVREVMLKHGALAVLSLDGRMAVTIERNTDLKAGSTVLVYLEDDTEVEGKVESATGGKLVVSIKDDGYEVGEKVIVETEDGDRLGSGNLYVHNAWNATAYYGTISKVKPALGDTLKAGAVLFELEVGDYSAQFQILNAQRQEYEELMLELFRMYDSGVITAPCDGIVTDVDDDGTFLLAAAADEPTWQVQLLRNVVWKDEPTYSTSMLFWPGPQQPSTPDTTEPTNPSEPTDPALPTDPTEPQESVTYYQVKAVSETGVTLQKINSSETVPVPVTTYADGSAIAVGDLVTWDGTTITKYSSSAAGGMGQQGGMPSGMGGMPGGMGGMGGGMGGSVAAYEPYTLDTLTIANVTSQEEMTLEISIDEHDIAKLYTGQQATISIEALTGQSFPATVTTISNTGTNEGGSSKFTAKLTLNKNGDMLPGMNASAFLTLETTEHVLTLPAAALVEEGTKTVVYTGYKEKDETLLSPVEVTTGVSDGEYVQILSGLDEGSTVYYAYYDTLEISNIPQSGGLPF